MANLFDKSKEKATVKKVEKHEIVQISNKFEKDLKRMAEIDEKLAELEAERVTLDSTVREEAKDAMIKLYDQKKVFPGTLKVMAGQKSFMFITSDKYIKIDKDRAAELVQLYGNDVITEKTVFTLNPALVDKYADELSDLIMKSKKIAAADKESLIESTTTWTVAKGMIEKLRTATLAKFKLANLIEDIKPIFMIKAIKE